jgi:hypothetical protein
MGGGSGAPHHGNGADLVVETVGRDSLVIRTLELRVECKSWPQYCLPSNWNPIQGEHNGLGAVKPFVEKI